MEVRLLFFGRLREALSCSEESLTLPKGGGSSASVSDILLALRARGGVWEEELAPGRALAFAVGRRFVKLDARVSDGDEVAIFPPVTGG